MRDSFIFYRSFFESIEALEDKDQLILLKGIMDYSLNGIEPNLNGVVLGMWKLIKPLLDSNQRKYEDGKKGGRPKKSEINKPVVSENENHSLEINKPVVSENENHSLEINKPVVSENEKIKKPNALCFMSNVDENENANSETSFSLFFSEVSHFWVNENIKIQSKDQINKIYISLLPVFGIQKLKAYIIKAFNENKVKYLTPFGLLNILERIVSYSQKTNKVLPIYKPPKPVVLSPEEMDKINLIKQRTWDKLNGGVVSVSVESSKESRHAEN
jgi:hypothetical protein